MHECVTTSTTQGRNPSGVHTCGYARVHLLVSGILSPKVALHSLSRHSEFDSSASKDIVAAPVPENHQPAVFSGSTAFWW